MTDSLRKPSDSSFGAFAGKVAVVTGAASGIGYALAVALARDGATVTAIDRDAETLRRAWANAGAEIMTITKVVADVRDHAAMKRAVDDTAKAHGQLDYIFNNAGIAIVASLADHTAEHWKTVLETNLLGVIHGVDAAYPHMVRQKSGHIVNTASLGGLVPGVASAAVIASKHGVVGLSHALRIEAEPLGVRVSVVCPASVETASIANAIVVGIERARIHELDGESAISAEACADAILRGVLANEETILPSVARMRWLVHRALPGSTVERAERALKRLAGMRTAKAG